MSRIRLETFFSDVTTFIATTAYIVQYTEYTKISAVKVIKKRKPWVVAVEQLVGMDVENPYVFVVNTRKK